MQRGEDVASVLRRELERLRKANAFEILGLPTTAAGDAVRQAFLDATKRHHPNRYAREPQETRELANEVFLLIRAAYEQLFDDGKRRLLLDKLAGRRVTASMPVATTPAPPPGKPLPVPPAAQPRPTPAGIPAVAAPRPTAPPMRPTAPPMRPTAPPMRPTAPPGDTPADRRAFPESRQVAPVNRSAADVNALLEQAKTRTKRYDDAHTALIQGRYREAREAFFKLASEDPQMRKYRVSLHLAWGLEHRAAGKAEDAQRELERALALDPENTDAAEALRKIEADKKKGLFSKLFGR